MNAPHRPVYETVVTLERLTEICAEAQKLGFWSFDTETTGLDFMVAELVGISISTAPGNGWYIPVGHVEGEQLPLQVVLDKVKPILESPVHITCGHNLKYDLNILARYGVTISNIEDSMLMSYSMFSGKHYHNMDDLSLKYLGHQTIKFKQVAGKGTFDQVPLDKATAYAAEDSDITLQLVHKFQKMVENDPEAVAVYGLDHAVLRVVSKMERRGVGVDVRYLGELTEQFELARNKHLDEAVAVAGVEFNPASPKQVGDLLTDRGVGLSETTPTGQFVVDDEVLQGLLDKGDLAPDMATLVGSIQDWRKYQKLIGTYSKGLVKHVNAETGRIHPSIGLASTITGRLACSDPNLQNIPIRTKEGVQLRAAFVAAEGHKLISADYSQIELRVLAHASGDENLIQAFKDGLDIHQAAASFVWGIPYDEVTKERRRAVKEVTFGIVYGKTPWGLAKTLGISESEAKGIIQTYFDRFPSVEDYIERARDMAWANGYVTTMIGRKIWLPDLRSSNKGQQAHNLRVAQNAPIQGTAADIIKAAMVKCEDTLDVGGYETVMLLQIHDELIFEAPDDEVEEVKQTIKAAMETAVDYLDVELEVGIGAADNWKDAH